MKKIIYCSMFLSIFSLFNFCEYSYSQVTQQWVQRYHGQAGEDYANSIAVDGSGNVFITGNSFVGGGTGFACATIKYNSLGVQQWVQRYNATENSNENGISIAADNSGNIYVTGTSIIPAVGIDWDYITIKYNSSGAEQWVQRYIGPGNGFDLSNSIAVDGLGNVYVSGVSTGSGTLYDCATIKYNGNGNLQWVQRYNGPGNSSDEANSIALDGSGNVYVSGSSIGIGTNFDYVTIKYNSSGVEQWVQRYNGTGNGFDDQSSIVIDGSENVYITGYSTGSGTGYDYATLKYNSNGVQQWVQRYNGPGSSENFATSIAVDALGNVYVTGRNETGSQTYYETIKYNFSGNEQWVQAYTGPGLGADAASSIAVDGTGNVYVTGKSDGIGTGFDYATIKYNTSGVQQWVQRYNGPVNSNDAAVSIEVDVSGNVYITGSSMGNLTGTDFATIKYSQDNPLPVELTSFTSIVTGRNVTLKWTTVSEVNNSGFEVERLSIVNPEGSGQVGEWSIVENVKGNGTMTTPYNYSFTDRNLNIGIHSYRLKQIDFNGNFQYFNLSNEVIVGIPSSFSLSQNYPNPFNPTTKIDFELPKDGNVKLLVYDNSSRLVSILISEYKTAGYYTVEFDASSAAGELASGVYFCKISIEANGKSAFVDTKRMMLLK